MNDNLTVTADAENFPTSTTLIFFCRSEEIAQAVAADMHKLHGFAFDEIEEDEDAVRDGEIIHVLYVHGPGARTEAETYNPAWEATAYEVALRHGADYDGFERHWD